jgi:hypothetical protein
MTYKRKTTKKQKRTKKGKKQYRRSRRSHRSHRSHRKIVERNSKRSPRAIASARSMPMPYIRKYSGIANVGIPLKVSGYEYERPITGPNTSGFVHISNFAAHT